MGDNNGIAQMLLLLQKLQGISFVRQLKRITESHEFTHLPDEPQIFTVGGEKQEDYVPLLDAARKAVEHGYRVFVLPNPESPVKTIIGFTSITASRMRPNSLMYILNIDV